MTNDEQFTTNIPKVIPYDTGKIKIGCRYEPQRLTLDDDEAMIQGMLLPSGGTLQHRRWADIIEWVLVVTIISCCVIFFVKD